MPLYEYRCSTCNQKFEVRQKFSDEPLSVHEGCGGSVRRLITAAGFHLKGSGWYATDYARAANGADKADTDKPAPKADGDSKPDTAAAKPDTTAAKSETKVESKPAPAASKPD